MPWKVPLDFGPKQIKLNIIGIYQFKSCYEGLFYRQYLSGQTVKVYVKYVF